MLQPLADILKLLMKEELRPKGADRWLFTLAPVLAVTAAFAAFATVPWGAETTLFGLLDEPVAWRRRCQRWRARGVRHDLDGRLWHRPRRLVFQQQIFFARGLRASAQMISYELSYATAIAAVILLAGSMSIREIVDAQRAPGWQSCHGGMSSCSQSASSFTSSRAWPRRIGRRSTFRRRSRSSSPATTLRCSSVRFALFPQAEYINMTTMAAVATNLYLGGWHGPFLPVERLDLVPLEGWRDSLPLYLGSLDGASLPIRPVDAVRLEMAVPRGGGQPDSHGSSRAVFQCLRRSFSICSPAS